MVKWFFFPYRSYQFCLMGGRLCFMSLKKHDSGIGKQLDVIDCGLVEQVTSGTLTLSGAFISGSQVAV